MLASRAAFGPAHMRSTLTSNQMLDDFKIFYFDIALAGHETMLTAVKTFVKPGDILFGTDFPPVSLTLGRELTWK